MIKAFLFTLAFFTFGIQNSDSTKIKVLGVDTLVLPNNEKAGNIIVSPNGNFLTYTSTDENVLKAYNFESQKVTEIASNAMVNSVVFSPNGKHLFFISKENKEQLRHFSFSNQKTETLTSDKVESINRWNWWYKLWRMDNYVWNDINLKALQNGSWGFPCVAIKNGQLTFYQNEQEKTLNPLGVQYYLHASLSPDKSKICAFAVGKGAFVCDTNGENIVELGNIEAPVWIGNTMVSGMKITDDGHEITSSEIMAIDLETKKEQIILDGGYNALYPKFNREQNMMICSSKSLNIYLVKLREIN